MDKQENLYMALCFLHNAQIYSGTVGKNGLMIDQFESRSLPRTHVFKNL